MDKNKILRLIDEPQLISETDLERLEEIVATYPYFQVAHLLIAKYTQDKESMLAPQKIRRASSYALDRNQLRKFILTPAANGKASLKLKTHFEALDDDTPKMQSVFEKTEDFSTLSEKNIVKEDAEVSFFDVIDSEAQVTSTAEFEEENLNEAYALDCFHGGKTEEAERIFKQLVLLHPEKASYYYKQLAVFTDKEEYLELAQAHQPAEEKKAAPFFENIPQSSLSETESLINQGIENSTGSKSFFEGIEQERQEIVQTDATQKENAFSISETIQSEEPAETSENTSFFDQVEEKNETILIKQDEVPSLIIEEQVSLKPEISDFQALIIDDSIPPNQATEDVASYFMTLEAVEDIHAIERMPETDPFEELRKEAKAPQNEEPFEIKPEAKVDNSFFDALEEEDAPPARTNSNYEEDFTETKAIYLFNQGRNKEAIEIYEKLLEKNPQKASYYLSQINVIKSLEPELKPISQLNPTPSFISKEEEEPSNDNVLSERLAIQLFNDGKLQEAIEIYNQLKAKEKREDKIAYYDQQIAILKS